MNLQERILYCRKKAGLSQEALAERIGVSRQAVSKWETGEATPELSTLVALAKEFGVSTDWLLSMEEDAAEEKPQKETSAPQAAGTASSGSLDAVPGVIGRLIRRFGWLLGVYVSIIGAGIAGLGALARFIAGKMISAASHAFDGITNSFDNATGQMFGGGFDPFGGTSSIVGSMDSAMNAMAQNNPVSIIGGVMIVLGVVILIGGVILAAVLKVWGNKKS